jgi:hypothetical protein
MKLFRKKPATISDQFRSLWKLILQILNLKIVKILFVISAILIVIPTLFLYFYFPKVQSDIKYGTTFSNKYATELGMDWKDTYIKVLDDLGARNLRLVAYWDEVEPVKDQYDYSNIKWQLDEAKKRDAKVILAFGRKAPRFPECFEPDWWKQIPDRESRQLELYEYIKETVTQLKDYDNIEIWQVENEPYFPFGDCQKDIQKGEVDHEVQIVRGLDTRPILIQDSGEGGLWYPSYQTGDYLSISMYRRIWYDFWGLFGGRFIYFQYPLPFWSYKIKAALLGIPYEKVFVTELQAEPWGPGINSELSLEEKNKTLSRADFYAVLNYAQNAGFKRLYLWGAEWWLWEKEKNNNPYFWDTAKALFSKPVE